MRSIYVMRLCLLLLGLGFLPWDRAEAFPENVRLGYNSCQTCHFSPTGGGVLTEYGRRTGEEFMAMRAYEKEGDFLHGLLTLPEFLAVGGDVRFLSLDKDNRAVVSKVGFPMQADLELGVRLGEHLSGAASFGQYDGMSDIRRYFLMYTHDENWHARVGHFFPAFGIQSPDHALLTRKLLNFNQRQETTNVEAGFTTESTQILATAMVGNTDGEEILSKEDGFALRVSQAIGKGSILGLSYLRGSSEVWDRDAVGPFAIIGFTPQLYLTSELVYQAKSAAVANDPSLPDHALLVSSSKFGWEATKGLQLFVSFESADPMEEDYLPKQRVFGPGFQWIPRPHFEFYAKLEKRLDTAFSRDWGHQALLLSHYWF